MGAGAIPGKEGGQRRKVAGLSPVFIFVCILFLSPGLGEGRLGLRRDRPSLGVVALMQVTWAAFAGWENIFPQGNG